MFKIHLFFNGELAVKNQLPHCPRIGDTVRLQGEQYGKVTEVVWCFDEKSDEGQRVNIRVESLEDEQ